MTTRKCRSIITLCLLALTLGVTAPFAAGQVEQGRFVGRITDPADAVIVGAVVKVTNSGTNTQGYYIIQLK